MVVLVPVPLVVAPPGLLVRVQLPEAGSPFITTLPVPTLQVGWVMLPVPGADGVTGWVLIITGAVAAEVHATSFVIV